MPEIEKEIHSKTLEPLEPSCLNNVLNHVAIRALCRLLQTDISLCPPEAPKPDKTFEHWAASPIQGDLNGMFGLGCSSSFVRTVSKPDQDGTIDFQKTTEYIFSSLTNELIQQFLGDDFNTTFTGPSYSTDKAIQPSNDVSVFCPIQTKYGTIYLYLSLQKDSFLQLQSQLGLKDANHIRKIRVSAQQLDTLADRISIVSSLENQLDYGPNIRADLKKEIKRVKRILNRMKSEPMDLLFTPAKKLISDISNQQKKIVELHTEGTHINLDKSLLGYLYGPILHLIRNAVDHGIEEPLERERLGKPAKAYVKCLISFESRGLQILVTDDGRGIDTEKIREQAVFKGKLPQLEADQKLDAEILPMIFEAGFSTKGRVDSISGRGLGLNIVQKEIENIGGNIRIQSTSHHGTSIAINIPLNEELNAKGSLSIGQPIENVSQDDERSLLQDELNRYFERLFAVLEGFDSERYEAISYEAFRICHSIRGITSFFSWNRISLFCNHLEDLFKSISDGNIDSGEEITFLVEESVNKFQRFCELAKNDQPINQSDIRRIEGLILRALWKSKHEASEPKFSFGKYHRTAVESLTSRVAKKSKFSTKNHHKFDEALNESYGTLMQFTGDYQGYAAISMPEKTLIDVIQPLITGSISVASLKRGADIRQQLDIFSEFSHLTGREITEQVQKNKVNLQVSSCITYFNNKVLSSLLGGATYCYQGSLNEYPFYLYGDLRPKQENSFISQSPIELPFVPSVALKEASHCFANNLTSLKLSSKLLEPESLSQSIGYEGGMSFLMPLPGKTSAVLAISMDPRLVRYLFQTVNAKIKIKKNRHSGVFECIEDFAKKFQRKLQKSFKANQIHIDLGTTSQFVGKLRLPSQQYMHKNNKISGSTSRGNFEIQVFLS